MKKPEISVLGLFGHSVFMQVHHFHSPGETVHAQNIYEEPGGKGYNQAVAAARLGGRVAFYGCGGNDDSCDRAEDFLKQEGIEPHIRRREAASTAYACILTDSFGENRVTVYRGAADLFSPADILAASQQLASSRVILLNREYPDEVNEAVLDLAAQKGIPVILNPAPAMPLPPDWIGKIHLFTPNRQEACAMLGLEPDAQLCALAAAFQKQGVRRAVVTLGAEGALLVEDGRALHFPGLQAEAVDTTGAGDTFNGALAVAVGQGRPLPEAVEFAMNAAALSVEKRFVMPAIPTLREVEDRRHSVIPVEIKVGGSE